MTDTPRGRSGTGSISILQHISRDRERSEKNASRSATRAGQTVLVVDDEPAMRYVTVKLLQSAGFRTAETPSGYEALSLAASASAVVLDVNLPDVHGIEVCAALRAQPATSKLPVVLTSAVYVDDLHRDSGLASGADAYLIAPLNPEELTSTLVRLIGD